MNGKIAMWQHRAGSYAQEHWIVLPAIELSDSFIQIQWSPAHSLLAANNISDVIILNEQPISTSISVQVSDTKFSWDWPICYAAKSFFVNSFYYVYY